MTYRTIVADPPWDHSDGYPKRRGDGYLGGVSVEAIAYPTLPVNEICALPISELCATDCRLFLWTTNRYLPDAFGVLGAWGFSYRQTLVWHKTNAAPFSGSVAVGSAEFLLVGVTGSPPVIAKASSSVISLGHHHHHSRKPEAFLDLVEQVSPGPYLELFARRQRLGWDTWGNQALEHVAL